MNPAPIQQPLYLSRYETLHGPLSDDPTTFIAWVKLVAMAATEEATVYHRGRSVPAYPGDIVASESEIAGRLGVTRAAFRAIRSKLMGHGYIQTTRIDDSIDKVGSIISILDRGIHPKTFSAEPGGAQ